MLLTGAAAAVALGGDPAWQWLEYQRSAIFDGQWWRLLTGHLVHAGFTHLVMNLAALALLWRLAPEPLEGVGGLVRLGWVMLCTSVALLVAAAEIAWYVGLSGVLHGVAVLAGWQLLRDGRGLGGWLLVIVAAKLAGEAFTGSAATDTLIGVPVVEAAHRYGALAGVAWVALETLTSRQGGSADKGEGSAGPR